MIAQNNNALITGGKDLHDRQICEHQSQSQPAFYSSESPTEEEIKFNFFFFISPPPQTETQPPTTESEWVSPASHHAATSNIICIAQTLNKHLHNIIEWKILSKEEVCGPSMAGHSGHLWLTSIYM